MIADARALPFPDDHFGLVVCSPPFEAPLDVVADIYTEARRVGGTTVFWVSAPMCRALGPARKLIRLPWDEYLHTAGPATPTVTTNDSWSSFETAESALHARYVALGLPIAYRPWPRLLVHRILDIWGQSPILDLCAGSQRFTEIATQRGFDCIPVDNNPLTEELACAR